MRKIYVVFLVFLFSALAVSTSAQMIVANGQTAQQLAEVIAGAGVVVSNATITGSPDAIGSFTTGANPTGLNVGSGVVFGTGNVVDFGQDQTTFSSSILGTTGNPYLANLAGITSSDALTLEFDFVPNADWVSFEYVFGSEEHPTYSCNPTYNDIFAITVQGVSVPLAETLITLVPGTATPVSIGTINDGGCGNAAYFVDNTALNSQYIVFGGFTTVLTAEMAILCGETYHLRMMISDGGDSSFDTGCFVAENSLTTGNVTIETASLGGDTTAIEGCADIEITLTLNGDPPTQDYPVSLWLSDASTAEWGVDYDPITALNLTDSTIVIPAGSNSVTFSIVAINDNIPEGIETIDLIAITSTCGTIDTFSLYIVDLDSLVLTASPDTVICMNNAVCWANTTGGGGDYTYTWQGFGDVDTISPSPVVTTTYFVSVADECGSTPATDSVVVTFDNGPPAFAGNDISVCIGATALMNASSSTPNCTFEWNPPTDLSATNIYNPLCTPQADIEYIVTATRSDGCTNDDTVNVMLTPPPTAEFSLPVIGCAGAPVLLEYDGNATAAAQYQWDFDGGTVTNGSGMGPYAVFWSAPGIYDVELLVAWNGCLSPLETGQIEILGPPAVDAGLDVTFCSGELDFIGSPTTVGVNYTWSPINGVADVSLAETTVQLENPTHDVQVIEYTLTAEEQGCINTDVVEITVLPLPTAEFLIPDGKCFNVNSFDLLAGGYFGPNATFSWDFGSVGFPSASTLMQPEGIIFNAPGEQQVTLTIEDNACVSEPFIGIIDVYEMPQAEFTSDVVEGCEPLSISFQDQSFNGNSFLYYSWNFGDGTSSTEMDPLNVFESGNYSVALNVVTSEGCANQIVKSNYLEVFEKPDALFSMSSQQLDILFPKVIVTNQANSIVSSEFTFEPTGETINAMETSYEYLEVGTYGITQIVETAHGCLDTISSKLEVIPHYTLYIPNAFTPDGNRYNETWIPKGESVKMFHMTIFNRWGQVLFYSASLNNGWDALYEGTPVPNGTYTYKIEVVDVLGIPHEYDGTFSLIR